MAAIAPLDAAFGASVEGIGIATPPSEALMRALTAALYRVGQSPYAIDGLPGVHRHLAA